MNCKDFESVLHEIVSGRATDKTAQLKALEHAGQCLCCALRLDEETKLTESLRGLALALQSQRAPVRVEEALLRAFRDRMGVANAPGWLAGKRFWRRLSWGLAFAATAATVGLVILQAPRFHRRSSGPPPQAVNSRPLASSGALQATQEQPLAPGQGERLVKTESAGAKSPATLQPGHRLEARNSTNQKREALIGNHRQSPSAAPAVSHGQVERAGLADFANEATTDFISLGTCDDPQCMDEATLVRVTLPAEALMAFGLAMDTDSSMEGLVQADVALGSDGVPFAIRFVN
jgi:hypothetical protein